MDKGKDSELEGEETPKFVIKVSHEAKLKELLRNITSDKLKLSSDSSKEFIKLLKGDAGGEVLREYIQTSSMCTELLQAWKVRQESETGLSYVFSLISAILSHLDGMYKANDMGGNVISRALDKFARLIVDEKLDDVYKELKSKGPKSQKSQKAALLLLGSIARRGSSLASDVAKVFNFKLPIFSTFAERRRSQVETKGKNLTRKSFVGFAMSFLEVGKPRLLRWVLQQKVMYSGVLRGLGSDDEETIIYVLSTLRDKVLIEESLVPPGLRSVLFGSVTLDQLISISGRENGGLATELAQEVLSMVCTDPSNGLMPDIKRHPYPLKGNLTRLLGVMKKLKATENNYHRDLLLAIVSGKPSFGSAYLDDFPYNLEDHASPTWFTAVSLAANVVSSVGAGAPFGFLDSQNQDPLSFSSPDVQCVIKCISPRSFTRLVINKGLLHSDSLIKHGTLRLVLEALKLLDSVISALNSGSLKKAIEDKIRILLPDPQVLLSLLSSLNGRFKSPELNLKRATDSELVLKHKNKRLKTSNFNEDTDIIIGGISSSPDISLHGDKGEDLGTDNLVELDNGDDRLKILEKIWGLHQGTIPDMVLKDEETYLYSKLLDTLKLYHRTAPTVLEGSFDFFKVFPNNALALPTILQQSVLSLLIEYIGWRSTREVPAKIQPMIYKHLHPLLNLLMYSPIKEVKDQAYVLAHAAMAGTGAFDNNLREIGTWVLFLPGYSGNNLFVQNQQIDVLQNLSSVVVSFLCDAVSTTGNNLFKYWDLLRCHINQLKGVEDLSPEFSPLVLCVLEKCLRLLNAESGAFSLPEKTMISLYVSNTIKYLLQTQVEAGLLSSIVILLLSDERLEGRCSIVDRSEDLCEWRPLKNLLVFAKSVTDHQTCSIPLMVKDVGPSKSSLVNTIDNIKKVVRRGHTDELAGITKAFSFSMLCTSPEEILKSFPSVISLSRNLLGVPLSLLTSIIFVKRGLLGDISKLWPEMFFNGLEKVGTLTHSEGIKGEIIGEMDTDSIECNTSIAFGTLLERAPFYVLFPAFLSIKCSNLLGNSKLQDLLEAKLSEGTTDVRVSYFRLVFFWLYQIQSSYRFKPLDDLERLSRMCFTLLGSLLTQLFTEQNDSGSKMSFTPLTQYAEDVAEMIFCHPVVISSLECPFSGSKEFTVDFFGDSSEEFLDLARQGVHMLDYHVVNLVATTCDHFFNLWNGQNSKSQRITKAFDSLVQKLLLILQNRFDQCIKNKDLAPVIPTLFTLHSWIPFVPPFKLLELVDWMFSRIDLNDHAISEPALCVGLCIAGSAFDLLSDYLEVEEKEIEVTSFERIYFRVIEIASGFDLDVANLCLVKAVNVARTHKMLQNHCLLSLGLVVSRVVASTPIEFLNHCIRRTSKWKAQFLFYLTEISPLHLSIFGNLLSDMMSKYLLNKGNMMQACSYTISDNDFLMLLPTVGSYLDLPSMKSRTQSYKTLTDIPFLYWKFLSRGFSNWKNYVSRDIFVVEIGEFLPSSLEKLLDFVENTLLGKAIFMVRYYLDTSGNSVKLKERLKLFDSVCLSSGAHDALLDCDVSEIDAYSNNQSLEFLTRTVSKIEFCKMLLFPKDYRIEDGSDKEYMSRIKFVNKLVSAWQLLVKKFPSKNPDDFPREEGTNGSRFRLLEIFILENIMGLTAKINKYHVNLDLDSLPYIEKLARSALLHRFEDPTTLEMIQGIFTSVSPGKLTHVLVLKLLLAHSQFGPTIVATSGSWHSSQCGVVFRPMSSILRSLVLCVPNQDLIVGENNLQKSDLYVKQLEVLKLLRILFKCGFDFEKEDNGINSQELLGLLLSSYSATLSELDLEIYNVMRVIESKLELGPTFLAEMDYLWGSATIKVRKEHEKEQNVSIEAIEERRRNEFRENIPIDPKLCVNTVLYFPYDRTIDEGSFVINKAQQACYSNIGKPQVYDPVFILRFSIHSLSMGYIEPIEFASFGLLAVALVSLSSPHEEVRKLGYEALGRFKNALEKSPKRKDITRLRLLLTYVQNGIEEPWQKIPSITAIFVAEASFVLLDPSHDHYLPINKLLVHSSRVNMKCIPLFGNYFWSSSVNFRTDRLWILRLLYAGLNLEDDAQIYIRNSIPETLLSFYGSPLSDNESKGLIIQIVRKSVKLDEMRYYFVEQCGLLPWLSSIISFFHENQNHDRRSLLLTQLTVVLEVVDDVISSTHTIKWLQKHALEQLTELSSHLYKFLAGDIVLIKEKASLITSILRVLTSALRISQQREVYQPHFTLSVEGIYGIYEAVNAWSNGRYIPNAEAGLEAVLMSTPMAAIIHIGREKLQKFVLWAISTALQSNSTTTLWPKESYTHSLEEDESKESLISKLLRWLTASVILGLLSVKFKCSGFGFFHEKSLQGTLNSLFYQNEGGSGENQAEFGSEEILAAAIFYLQQLLSRKCSVLPSVISSLCLLLSYRLTESGCLIGDGIPLASLFGRIRCPTEANPAWRWSFDQPWKDLSFERTDMEKMDENQACRSLLVVISNILGRKSIYPQYLSCKDLKNSGVFEWEKSMVEANDV